MKFSKNTLLSIMEQVNTQDVDEMARRAKGTRKRKEGDPPPKFEPGWKENNPTPIGGEGVPDYWIVNPNQVEGESVIFVPVTCNEIEKYVNDNKEWLDSLGILHEITESPQVIYCENSLPKTHRVAEKIFAGGYKPTGESIPVGERIKRYSNRKKGEGFYDIIYNQLEVGDFAKYLSYCSIPPIINDIKHRDRYSDAEITNDNVIFKMISFDKYASLKDFLKKVVENIRPIANFNIPEENKSTYDSGDYLARLFNRIRKNWDPERKTDKDFFGYTEAYKLKRIGYEENDIDVMSSNYFELKGKLSRNQNEFIWSIFMDVKFGKKLKEDRRVSRLTSDKAIRSQIIVVLEPEEIERFSDTHTIMDNINIKQGLFEVISSFKEKVKTEITPQDALRLGRMTYANTTRDDEQINEERYFKKIITNLLQKK